MTFDEFKVDFIAFLHNSTVNLGRKNTKTRQTFLDIASQKIDAFATNDDIIDDDNSINPLNKSVMMIKPKDKRKSLNVGKGVHSMTASESLRADEQLNRSPYSQKNSKKD